LDVDAQLRRVNVLLRLGRAYTARAALAGLSRDKLGAAATQHLALSVRAAALLDDWTTVDALCKRHGLAAAPRHACARAMIERPLLGRARALIGGVRDARAKATLLAELALARGDAKGAQRALARVKSAIPTDLAAIVAASSASLRGDKSRALALLRRELAVRAPDIDLRLALSRVLIGAGHDSEAREQLEHVIAAKPEAARVIAAVGVAMLGLGATDQAKRVLASAPEQARGSTALRLLAGRVALVEGDHTKARATLRGVLRDNPRDTDALIALARLAAEGKKRRLAGAYLARALKVRPDDPALQLSMARVYTALGRYRKALGPGLKAVRLFKQRNQDARSLDALINLGRMFGRSRDKWALARAEELLFEVCKDKSAPAVAFLELGLVHGRQRNRALAIVNLRKAVRRDPANARAVRALGLQLYSKRRSRRTAKKWLRKYLKLAPKAKDAKRIRALLKKR
ncbi:MAG: hypothetical protein KC503_07635, partial [Myxococcales bacterium]|nr:hypothetical protein [Myxococcales bacterium]